MRTGVTYRPGLRFVYRLRIGFRAAFDFRVDFRGDLRIDLRDRLPMCVCVVLNLNADIFFRRLTPTGPSRMENVSRRHQERKIRRKECADIRHFFCHQRVPFRSNRHERMKIP